MVRKLYLLLIGSLLTGSAYGQQDPQFSLFPFTPTLFNPAAVGSEAVTRIQFIHRNQWAGYQTSAGASGSPTTELLTASLPIKSINSGAGIYAFSDQLGPVSNQSFQLAYAYRLPLKSGTFSIGLQGGLFNKRIDYTGVIVNDPNDPLVPTGIYSQIQPDISAGLYYSTVDYWVGASLFHINAPAYKLGTDRAVNPLSRTAYLSAGYRLGFTDDIDLQPSVLYKYSTESGPKAASLDVNVLGTYSGRYFGGISYRVQESLTLMAGLNLLANNALRFGIAYDAVAFGTSAKKPSSYELMLSYALPAPNTSKKPIIRTPRFRH